MELLKACASILAACASFGALIDFFIGKKGQQRAKDWLAAWWIQLNDVTARSFGRDEARMTAQMLEAVFGRFLSWRRVLVILVLVFFSLTGWAIASLLNPQPQLPLQIFIASTPLDILRLVLVLSASISITQVLCVRLSGLLDSNALGNLMLYAIGVVIQLVVLEYVEMLSYSLAFRFRTPAYLSSSVFIHRSSFALFSASLTVDGLYDYVGGVLVNFGSFLRLFLLALFSLSVLFNPFKRFVELLLLRLNESEKPVFTLLFGALGGLAGISTAAKEIVALL